MEDEQGFRKPTSTIPLIAFGAITFGMLVFVAPFFRKGVPFMPTTTEKTRIVFELLENQISCSKRLSFVDLGSGDGRMVLAAARHQGQLRFTKILGVERNTSLYLISKVKSILSTAKFVRKSFWDIDTKPFDVVYIFGIPALMDQFAAKLRGQRPGTFIITNKFPLPGWSPVVVKNEIHLYRVYFSESSRSVRS
jgi:hypothetical protein